MCKYKHRSRRNLYESYAIEDLVSESDVIVSASFDTFKDQAPSGQDDPTTSTEEMAPRQAGFNVIDSYKGQVEEDSIVLPVPVGNDYQGKQISMDDQTTYILFLDSKGQGAYEPSVGGQMWIYYQDGEKLTNLYDSNISYNIDSIENLD